MISIIDYGCGNLRSAQKAMECVGNDCIITGNKQKIIDSSAIILPGVGAFSDAMKMLTESDLIYTIKNEVKKGKPLLGICLGMQMLFDKSYEDGEFEGLGLIKGEVLKFDIDLKIPHIGWNEIELKKTTKLFDGVQDKNFYFVHSYHADKCNQEDVESVCFYGKSFISSVNKDNIWGVQFHPEKSGDTGLKLLKNFGELQ